MSKNHVIVGAGAMGMMYASRLFLGSTSTLPSNSTTWLFCSERRARELVFRSSFQVQEIDGACREIPLSPSLLDPGVRVCTSLVGVPSASTVLLCVKHKDTRAAAEQLLGFASSETEIVSLQNGIGNIEIVREVLGDSHPASLYQGVSYLGAKLSDNGVISTGMGKTLIGAAIPGAALAATFAVLKQNGLEAEAVSDASSVIWTKLLANAVINPLTAILNVPNGFVTTVAMNELVESLANEVVAVANAVGVAFDLNNAASPVEFVRSVARATETNSSSMLVDIQAGRETEIEAINGGIVRLGRKLGIPTPANELVRSLVIAKGKIS